MYAAQFDGFHLRYRIGRPVVATDRKRKAPLIEGPGPLPNITQGPEKSTWSQFLVAGHNKLLSPSRLGPGIIVTRLFIQKALGVPETAGGLYKPIVNELIESCAIVLRHVSGIPGTHLLSDSKRDKILGLCSPTTIGKERLNELLTLARRS